MRHLTKLFHSRPRSPQAAPAALAVALAALCGCSHVENLLSGDKIDYKSQAVKTSTLEVPPDLTQLQRDSRYQPQASGTVSATTFQTAQPAAAAASAPAVAAVQVGEVRIERNGDIRWLVTSQTPEQLWPQIRSFWQDRGFNIATENAEAGVMETDWAENRAKLPNDIIRNTLGKVLDSLYSTGERDKFRTRLERTATGTEIFITHRRMEEVLTGQSRDNSTWTARPADPQLEAEMLSRLMVKLGTKEEEARAAVANAGTAAAAAAAQGTPARARLLSGQGPALQLDEPFDRAWRRVGLALDRSGFTVEDRDRAGGVYYVRYVDPKQAGKEDKGFLSKLFGKSDDAAARAALARYRIAVKSSGSNTTVSVLDSQGAPASGEVGQRIVALLVDDLK
ncbi:MAG TPA: outer membrane protein assembly factor BamC [Burkholderiaceae bacterium]|nr:outer membrane protein assembly factor BamC [Burkholderiaceae bacterium]